jgi:P27 family predicted phage terminase small subunit
LKKSPRTPPADPVPTAPRGLSHAAASWWKRFVNEYQIDDECGVFLLEQALRAYDRMQAASALIAQHGEVTEDRFGQLRANPAASIERDARAAMLAAFRQLNLSVEPLHDAPGRPFGT